MTRQRDFSLLPIALILCASLMMSHSGISQVNVTRFSSPSDLAGKQGMVYALPRTVFKLDITVIKTEEVKGPLANFSSEMLNLGEVIMHSRTSYSIGSIVLSSMNEPDPEQFYFVEMADKAQQLLAMAFNSSGLIMGIEEFEEDIQLVKEGKNTWYSEPGKEAIFRHYTKNSLVEDIDTFLRITSMIL